MEHDFYQMYLEELEAVPPMSQEEKRELLKQTAAGSETARKRLVEGSLREMTGLIEEFRDQELPMSDLIQEANTALMLAAVEYDGERDWDELLKERVREAVKLALEEQ